MASSRCRACVPALFLLGFAGPAGAQEPVDLATLPGYEHSRPKGLNESGDVVGQAARTAGEPTEQAVLWRRSRRGNLLAEALPPLAGLDGGDARAFASERTPVGFSYVAGSGFTLFRAVAWRKDASGLRVAVDLEPPAGFTDAQAYSANWRGEVVGEAASPAETVNGTVVRHAMLWQRQRDGSYEACDLGVPEGFDASTAFDLNEAGSVVGTARRLESDGAGGLQVRSDVVVWQRVRSGHDCAFRTLPLESRDDLPFEQNPSINERGDVVARADRLTPGGPTLSRALLWSRQGCGYAAPVELPLPKGFTDAFARDLNSHGEIVGTALVRSPAGATTAARVVVWRRGARGRFVPTLLASPAGASIAVAEQVNERGDVVGSTPMPAAGQSGGLLWKKKRERCADNGQTRGPVEP